VAPTTAPAALPTGVTTSVETDPYPFGVTVAFDRVWVTSHDGDSVNVIDPVTNQVTRTVGLAVQPGSVVSGAGSIWVQSRTDDSLFRIDPETYDVTTIDLPGVGSLTCSIAFAHGLVWAATVGNAESSGTVFQVDPATGTVATRTHVDGFPCGWVSMGKAEWTAVEDGLVHLVPGNHAAKIVPFEESRPSTWLVGALGGQLYVLTSDGMLGSQVLRVDESGKVTGRMVTHSDLLFALVSNDEGLWFWSDGTDEILVVDPRSLKFSDQGTLRTGEVVVDPGMPLTALWLPDSDNSAVVKIDPGTFLQPAA
jgi:YVTN family beta-propeller protein